jgi:hypothetical protein
MPVGRPFSATNPGNPKGRPPAAIDISALARQYGPKCIEVAAELLTDPDPRIRLAAVVALLDRGFGRPKQMIEGADGTSPSALHLLAAIAVSRESLERMEQRATISGTAEPVGPVDGVDLLLQPPPLE